MSDERQTLPSGAVDQGTRAREGEPAGGAAQDVIVPTEDDIVEDLKRQLADLEERDRRHEEERRRERTELAAERRRASEADARAQNAEARANAEAETGRRSVEDAQLESVDNAISARNREMDALKASYTTAFSEGDGSKIADIQAQMAVLGGELAQLRAGKTAIEARKQAREADPGRQAQPQASAQPSIEDQQDRWIRTTLPPRQQEWVRDHRDQFFSDQAFQRRVIRYAQEAQEDFGYDINSQDVIDHINQRLGLSQAPGRTNGGGNGAGERPPAQPSSATRQDRRLTAAPAGGSVAGVGGGVSGGGGGANEVWLTREQKRIAAKLGMTEGEYARHYRDGVNEGLIGPGAKSR